MTEISPSYYAGGQRSDSYILRGESLNLIPSDAVGLYATNNDDPLENRYRKDGSYLYSIEANTGDELSLRVVVAQVHSSDNYLGGIVSADRTIVYWVNDTRPLS